MLSNQPVSCSSARRSTRYNRNSKAVSSRWSANLWQHQQQDDKESSSGQTYCTYLRFREQVAAGRTIPPLQCHYHHHHHHHQSPPLYDNVNLVYLQFDVSLQAVAHTRNNISQPFHCFLIMSMQLNQFTQSCQAARRSCQHTGMTGNLHCCPQSRKPRH